MPRLTAFGSGYESEPSLLLAMSARGILCALVAALLSFSCLLDLVSGSALTVYNAQGPIAIGSKTSSSNVAAGTAVYDPPYGSYSGYAAYNAIVLAPPPVPSGLLTQYDLVLPGSAANVDGLSIPQSGAFLGFSVEMSVVTQVGEWKFNPRANAQLIRYRTVNKSG